MGAARQDRDTIPKVPYLTSRETTKGKEQGLASPSFGPSDPFGDS